MDGETKLHGKLKRRAKKIGYHLSKYIEEYRNETGEVTTFLFIKYELGEILCFADNLEEMKEHVKYLR